MVIKCLSLNFLSFFLILCQLKNSILTVCESI